MKNSFLKWTAIITALAGAITRTSVAQHLGKPMLPENLPKTCTLIEIATPVHIEAYVPIPGFTLPANSLTNGDKTLGSNVYVRVEQNSTNYLPVASAVFFVLSNVCFIVTADHVVAANPELSFRIPQKNGAPPRHLSHKQMLSEHPFDWVRDTQSDLAVIPYLPDTNDDFMVVSGEYSLADYDDVKVGDEVYVLGCPSSVVGELDPSTHYVRNGIVSSKLDPPRIILDAFVFPGNSGGPVFWKPSLGLHYGAGLSGTDIEGREPKLVGIVSAVMEYKDEAFSRQTGHSRVTFEENSGLTVVISSSAIKQIMQRPNILEIMRLRNEFLQSKEKPVSK